MAYKLKTFSVSFVSEPDAFLNGTPTCSADDVQRVARSIYSTLDADKEHFVLLSLNNKNRINGFKVISTGSLTASLVHPREVYRAALAFCAAAVVFVHNHPAGDPAPSAEDIEITKRLKQAGDILGIRVLDHIVLGDADRYFSFSDKGLLEFPTRRE
jgi:DNA repair protein RadC